MLMHDAASEVAAYGSLTVKPCLIRDGQQGRRFVLRVFVPKDLYRGPYTPLLAAFCGYSRCSCPVQICTSRLVYGKSCTPKSSSSHAATRELEMPLCGKVIAYPTPSGGLIVLHAIVSQMRTVVVPWEALRSSLSSIFPRPDALLQRRHLHTRSLRFFPVYHSELMHLVLM